jgi:hypothetical protein
MGGVFAVAKLLNHEMRIKMRGTSLILFVFFVMLCVCANVFSITSKTSHFLVIKRNGYIYIYYSNSTTNTSTEKPNQERNGDGAYTIYCPTRNYILYYVGQSWTKIEVEGVQVC